MKIKVEIRTIFKNTNSPLKAQGNVILDECFMIRNVKLIENENGMFLSMPSTRINNTEGNQWRSICHPLSSEFRVKLQDEFIKEYNKQ